MSKRKRVLSNILVLAIVISLFTGIAPILVYADGAADHSIANLNIYGAFESEDDTPNGLGEKWIIEYGSDLTPSLDDDYHGGLKSQKITAANKAGNSVNFDFVRIEASKKYLVKFWAKVPEGIFTLYGYELNSSWGLIDGANLRVDISTDDNQGVWKEYSAVYVPKAGAEHVGIRLTNWASAAMTAYIDDITMVELITIPIITLDQPAEVSIIGDDQQLFTVSGTVVDGDRNLSSFQVNGIDVAYGTDGKFSTEVALDLGENIITVTAKDAENQITEKTISVTLTSGGTAPVISINQNDSTIVTELDNRDFTVSGTIQDEDDDFQSLKINGEDVAVIEGIFSTTVALKIGQNTITAVAADEKNNQTTKTISVTLKLQKEAQPYDIGVFYFSDWNPELSPYMIQNTKNLYGRDNDPYGGIRDHLISPGPWGYGPIPDREPLLGWYDDRQQEILDQHILQASSRGIDHFVWYYYWGDGSAPRPGQNVENFKTSPYRDLMDYYICFVADGAYNSTHWRSKIVPKFIEFMKEPYYKTVKSDNPDENGRPILGFFGDMKGRLGGTSETLKAELDYLRAECIKAGLKNPLLLYDGYRTLNDFIAQGYDGFLPLNLAGIGLDDNVGVPEDIASAYPDAWKEFVSADYTNRPQYQNYENYLFIPGGLNAFDSRPWRQTGSNGLVETYIYADPSPEKFKAQLENVKEYLDDHERSMNMATFYAWNEWGEGGSIEPNTLFGYGYIDAMQEVFGLKNANYKLTAEDNGFTDVAPDVRIDVEPNYSSVTEGQEVILKVRVKNYSDESVTGSLSLSQPAKNAEGIDQSEWTVDSSVGTNYTLAPGAASEAEFVVPVGEGDYWARHNFIITDGVQNISTFIVKVPDFYGCLEKDTVKTYKDFKFDLNIKVRNYTMDPNTVDYTLELPVGWTADELTGTMSTAGYSGTGPHTGRTVKDTIVVSYPSNTEPGNYTIKLTTTDGEFTKVEDFTISISELFNLLYNGSFEIDENSDGMPDVWSGNGGANITIQAGTEESLAPMGNKYVKVVGTTSGEDHELGIIQQGTKGDINWLLIDPNKKYQVSFWAKIEKGEFSVIDYEAQGINYEPLGRNLDKEITFEENGNEWKQYSFEFFPNAEAGRESLRFFITSNPGDETIFYLDAVMLREMELTPEENMIQNGNMENDYGWLSIKTGGTFELTRDWADQYGGRFSQKLSGTGSDGSYVAQEWLDIDPAKQYIVEFWANVSKGTFTVVSAEKSGDNGVVTYNTGLDFEASGGWQKYLYKFRPQAGMNKSSLRFAIKGSGDSIAWIDNIVMKPFIGTPPVITLLGDEVIEVPMGDTFTDPGATAEDNLDGDITHNIIVTGIVNTNILGTYVLTYNVSDAEGTTAIPVTRAIKITGHEHTVSNVTFRGIDSNILSKLPKKGFVIASADIRNNTATARSVTFVIVLYNKKGQIENLTSETKEIASATIETFTGRVKMPGNNSGYYLEVFLANSLTELKPISDIMVLRQK